MCTTRLPEGILAGYTKPVTMATHKTVALLQWCCPGNTSYHSLRRVQLCWGIATENLCFTVADLGF